MSNYERCFEKHSFHELNSIAVDKFDIVLRKHRDFFKNDAVLFDVGCNAGSFIKTLKSHGIEQGIYCFEPHPVLSKTVKDMYPYVRMNEFCLSNSTGVTTMSVPTWSVGLSSLIHRPVFGTLGQEINNLTVYTTTLDAYCKEYNIHHIDFIKIDVEGAEKMVFEGAHELLSTHRIASGLFEVGQTLVDAGSSTEEVCALIEGYGYTLDKSISESDVFFYLSENPKV